GGMTPPYKGNPYGDSNHFPNSTIIKWRADGKCDAKRDLNGVAFRNVGPHGGIAECDPNKDKPCCSAWGFCGLGQDEPWNYCDCPTCTDYRKPNRGSAQWRDDERCGSKNDPNGNPLRFLAPNGRAAECDPKSDKPCCSAWGYCGSGTDGNGHQYCNCPTCTDHRRAVTPGSVKWRDDNRCGSKNDPTGNPLRFLAPNGRVAECDPRSDKPCCSAWGYCGSGADGNGHEYCYCPTCTDHRRAVNPGIGVTVLKSLYGPSPPSTPALVRYPLPFARTLLPFTRPPPPAPVIKWRADKACEAKTDPNGIAFRNVGPHGGIAECDPNSSKPCCSVWGFCGLGQSGKWNYCDCPTCTDYRKPNKGSTVNKLTWASSEKGYAVNKLTKASSGKGSTMSKLTRPSSEKEPSTSMSPISIGVTAFIIFIIIMLIISVALYIKKRKHKAEQELPLEDIGLNNPQIQ
ncbi:unnamed protein product, partial [Meganyctiphanes norvegica]